MKLNSTHHNKKTIVVSIVVALVIIIGSIYGYILLKDLKQEDILRVEISNLSKKDFAKDRYNMRIKTKDDYAVVEKAIKEYFDEYATTLQSLYKISTDKQMKNILSAANYSSDGPDFVKTKDYIETTKAALNDKVAKLTNMNTEEEIMKQIEDKNLDKYYVDLYKELMLSDTTDDNFKNANDNLKKISDQINGILNTEEEVINLLIAEKGKWTIENDKIIFESTDAINKYNELIKDYQSK